MSKNIKAEKERIDKEFDEKVQGFLVELQPLFDMIQKILIHEGDFTGPFYDKKKFRTFERDGLKLFEATGGILTGYHNKVFYNDEIVLEYTESARYKHASSGDLVVYKKGEWIDKIIEIYEEMSNKRFESAYAKYVEKLE